MHTSLLNIQNNTSSESNNGSIPVILNQNGPIITSVRTRNPSNLVKPITLSSTVQSQSKSLSFGCVNARSLKNKTEVFSDHVIDCKLDVCAVTETWLKKNDTVTLSALSPSGYIFKNIPRASDRTGGGTGILVRDNYNIHLVQAIERNSFEVSEWNVSTNGKTSKFVVVYRPPYSDAHPISTSVFFDEFAVFLESIVMCTEVLVISGDFNFHVNQLDTVDARKFADLLESFGLIQHVNFPTHTSGNCLDLIITRSSNDIIVVSPQPSLLLSDHCFVHCTLAIPSAVVVRRLISFRRWKKVDFTALEKDITSLTDLSALDCIINYDRTLGDIADKFAPLQNKLVSARPKVPWYDDDLKALKTNRRKLERKMRKTRLPSDVSAYRVVCNEYSLQLKAAKEKYYNELILDCKGDSKKLFNVVNHLCNERTGNQLLQHSCPQQLADDFGNYFSTKITRIRDEIPKSSFHFIDADIPSPEVNLDRFSHVSVDNVRDIIMASSNACCQLDPIPTWVVKKCVVSLAPIITAMINSSFDNGYVPESWKVALVVPFIKKLGLDPVFENFRPVSNVSLVSKIAEKSVIPQLLNHCSLHAPLPVHQSSYRQYHSTETALLKVQNDILLSMDRQEVTLLVLLDLSAAFDTIDHNVMVDLLRTDFGVTGLALSWLHSYLLGRKQRVVIDQQQSSNFDLLSGVPQGSCLGPLLFVLYASRLFRIVEKHLPRAHGYADDTQLYLSFRPGPVSSQCEAVRVMVDCISEIRSWMAHSLLKLNDKKTEFLIIGSRQQLAKVNIDGILVGSAKITPATNVRNLGVWFDSSLTMSTNVGKICSKAFFGLYKIKQIRKFLSADSTKTLVHAFVTSHLDYCNSLLYGISKYQVDRLQRVLNSAARVTCCVPRHEHITPILMQLHWLPIFYRIQFKIALLVYKVTRGMAPPYLCDLIEEQHPGRYPLRSNDKNLLKIPRTKTKSFGDRAFAVSAPTIWNNLPKSVRDSDNLKAFKTNLKTFLYKTAFLL